MDIEGGKNRTLIGLIGLISTDLYKEFSEIPIISENQSNQCYQCSILLLKLMDKLARQEGLVKYTPETDAEEGLLLSDTYQEWIKIELPPRQKIPFTLIFSGISTALILGTHTLIADQPGVRPYTVYACVIVLASLGLYGLLAGCFKEVPAGYFLAVNILILTLPVAYLGAEFLHIHHYHQERKALAANLLLKDLKQEIEQQLDKKELENLELTPTFLSSMATTPTVERLSLTSLNRLLLTCNPHQCKSFIEEGVFNQNEHTTQVYAAARRLCHQAEFRIPLQQGKEVVGQLCVKLSQ